MQGLKTPSPDKRFGTPNVSTGRIGPAESATKAFVIRNDMLALSMSFLRLAPTSLMPLLSRVTAIQKDRLASAKLGLDAVRARHSDFSDPVTFAACDNGLIYNEQKLNALLKDDAVDIILWGTRGYANAVAIPEMYGWIDLMETW